MKKSCLQNQDTKICSAIYTRPTFIYCEQTLTFHGFRASRYYPLFLNEGILKGIQWSRNLIYLTNYFFLIIITRLNCNKREENDVTIKEKSIFSNFCRARTCIGSIPTPPSLSFQVQIPKNFQINLSVSYFNPLGTAFSRTH